MKKKTTKEDKLLSKFSNCNGGAKSKDNVGLDPS